MSKRFYVFDEKLRLVVSRHWGAYEADKACEALNPACENGPKRYQTHEIPELPPIACPTCGGRWW